MAGETRYRIIFRGSLREGFDESGVRANLVAAFGITDEQAADILSSKAAILRRGLNRADADRFAEGLSRAGMVCDIQPEPVSRPADDTPHAFRQSGSGSTEGVLDPPKVHGNVRFSPVNCPLLAEHDGMLDTGRADMTPIPFVDVVFASVWAEEAPNGQSYRLVLFASGQRRPLQAADNAIDFRSFPGEASATAMDGLRRLVRLLRDRNPALRIDAPTAAFLEGRLPPIYDELPLAHITAIGTALIDGGFVRDEQPGTYGISNDN